MLENSISGQQLVFRKMAKDTRGELLEVKSIYAQAPPFRPPVHYHPYQDERLKVLSGKLRVLVDGEYPQLAAGRPARCGTVQRARRQQLLNESGAEDRGLLREFWGPI